MLHFAAIGDLHLNSLKRYGLDNGVIYEALESAFEIIDEKLVNHVILLGDIFDTFNPSVESIIQFLNWLKSKSAYKIYMISGNHDINQRDDSGINSLSMVRYLTETSEQFAHVRVFTKPTRVKIKDVLVNFLPYPHHNGVINALNIGHFETNGAFADNGFQLRSKITTESLKGKCWILGHLHTHQGFYPGTLYQVKFGENPEKGFFIGKTDGKRVELNFHATQLPYELVNQTISKYEDFDDLIPAKDPSRTIYSLIIKEDLAVPPDLRVRCTIHNLVSASSKRQIQSIVQGKLPLNKVNLEQNHLLDLLPGYLSESGLPQETIELGLSYTKKAMQSLGIAAPPLSKAKGIKQ